MLSSSSRSSQAAKPRRFDSRRTNALATPRSHGPVPHREDKNMNPITITAMSSLRQATKAPPAAAKTKIGTKPRPPPPPLIQSRFGAQKAANAVTKPKPRPRVGRVTSSSVSATKKVAPASPSIPSPPAPPPPPQLLALPLDPNCNEPSLPCLCCDGRSPQDSNSLFNHNHNNNNTISLRQQMQLPPPPLPVLPPASEDDNGSEGAAEKQQQQQRHSQLAQQTYQAEAPGCPAVNLEDQSESQCKNVNLDNKKKNNQKVEEEDKEEEDEEEDDDDDEEEEEEESSSGDIDIDDDEEEADDNNDDDEDDDDDDEDDDTLVPSCCDCPPSLLDFSLTSSTSSSSSTSISSCSDLESDCADPSSSVCQSPTGRDPVSLTLTAESSECCPPPARSPPSLPFLPPLPPCSPDEGYPSALGSPSPDYLGVKGDSGIANLGLLDFLESVGEFGKMERFSQVIQVARWDLEGEQHWDVLRDRLDHLDRLEKVNREVKLTYVARLHEQGMDLGELEEQDLGDLLDEMGNIDLSWKLYHSAAATNSSMRDSQEFSDAGVDLSDDPLLPDSFTPSPVEPEPVPRPPARPPKPPARHASVTSDLHTYINISRESTSVALQASPTLTTFSPSSSYSTFSTFRCEKLGPPSPPPPSVPPLPTSKPLPYLSLYTTPSPPPSVAAPTPPIPPPRRRHLARKEAQRLAALQAERESTPLSLPPPTTRPPPLPPPPVISVTSSPPALPPPPSFHALDVEIRKLLMLAGVTQAELRKLSPELGVCVGGLEEEGEEGGQSPAGRQDFQLNVMEEEKVKQYEAELMMSRDGRLGRLDRDGNAREDQVGGVKKTEEAQRTTSFGEMARRRRRTMPVASESYYSTTHSSSHQAKAESSSFECYSPPPPPPPPRPLPPVPPSLPPSKVSTLPANSAQPERFDWLIAFTPDVEAPPPPLQVLIQPQNSRKAQTEVQKSLPGSSGKSSPGSAPKVTTTFKELRLRNKSTSQPTKVITDPEPDPSIITPDPDILYNLKWRREKAGGDGSQWEYTSQAQALFMQQPPPPALTSMAALKEMLQKADKEGERPKLCPSQRIGCSLSENSLWMTGRKWECLGDRGEDQEGREKTDKAEVRGQADGGRTLESRTSVSSPPLSLNPPALLPYFLHTAAPLHRPSPPGPSTSRPLADPRSCNDTGEGDSSAWGQSISFSADLSSALHYDSLADSPYVVRDDLITEGEATTDSMCNLDSLYGADGSPEEQHAARPEVDPAVGVLDCVTPYKNMDVVMTCSASHGAVAPQEGASRARLYKELPPLPSYYLHHPKNCPLHRGAPPRLSPIGALSPPYRSGAPPCGPVGARLSSPLFPRSHTLPALAAPLYYPGLYPHLPPRAPPLPPKLHKISQQSHAATVRSVSFAGSAQRAEASWMGDDVSRPARGLGPSTLCLQEKKVLVTAVSVAVEAILAQFSSSRTVVQKALSGDSAINPSLGPLLLQCLCPALHNLLADGLKPHQSDLIAGRRPNSTWALVQASTAPSPKTQVLFNLQVRVAELPHLRQSKYRFNAFLFGLLNTKCLDFWLSHLLSCNDVLESFYQPDSFMRLSLSACRSQFEELLLVLQPLSLLTFNLDLLFQHHHLEPDGHASSCRGDTAPPQLSQGEAPSSRYLESLAEVDFRQPQALTQENRLPPADPKSDGPVRAPLVVGQTSPQLLWVQEAEIAALPPPSAEEDSLAQQAGQVIQQGWGAVLRWGGKLSQNLAELASRKDEMKTDLQDLQAGSDFAPVCSSTQVPWTFGRLFGAPKSPNSPQPHSMLTRRPSQWLAPSVTALTRMVSSGSAPSLRRIPDLQLDAEPQSEKEADRLEVNPMKEGKEENGRALRSVRTLCDHAGTGSQLTFCKGEELLVLEGVDGDWIRCRQGDREGLVPIGYTSLIM